MLRFVPVVLGLVLVIYALVDCLQSPAPQVRALSKPGWLAVIVLVPVLGAVAWLLAGRPQAGPAGVSAPPRPVAPDDDPEFLAQLRSIDEEHERTLRQWERDLRRREERLRGPDEPEDGDDGPPGPPRP